MTTSVVSTAGISTTITELETGDTIVSQIAGPSTVVATAGQPGLTGPAGAGIVLVFPFTNAATWSVPHNLGRYPLVQLIDDTDAVFDADVEFPDPNTAVITHASPKSGSVLVS